MSNKSDPPGALQETTRRQHSGGERQREEPHPTNGPCPVPDSAIRVYFVDTMVAPATRVLDWLRAIDFLLTDDDTLPTSDPAPAQAQSIHTHQHTTSQTR